MNTPKTGALKGILCTVVGGIFWGFSGTCGEYLFSHYEVSTLWLTCVRELGAGLIMLLFAVVKRAPGLTGIWKSRRDVIQLVLFALGGLVLCQYSYMTAISYTNAGTTTVLQNLNLVIIMVLVCFAGRRWPKKKELLAAILAVTGTFLLATHGDPRHMVLSTKGLLWGLTTAGAVTIYTLSSFPPDRQMGQHSGHGVGHAGGRDMPCLGHPNLAGTGGALPRAHFDRRGHHLAGHRGGLWLVHVRHLSSRPGAGQYAGHHGAGVRCCFLRAVAPHLFPAHGSSGLCLHPGHCFLAGKDERAAQPPSDGESSLPSQAEES